MRSFISIAFIFLFASCAKDLPIPATAINKTTLQDETQEVAKEKVRFSALAFCGNHHSFGQSTNRLPIHVLTHLPDGATDIKYHETDTLTNRDSLGAYTTKALDNGVGEDGFFHRFYRPSIESDRFCRVSYILKDTLYITEAITLRAATLSTNDLAQINTFVGEDGYFTFDWPSIPGTSRYIWILTDQQEKSVLGVQTTRSSFRFFDLRDADINFFPAIKDPQLSAGGRYTAHLFAITNRGWLLAIGSHTFQYPPAQ